MTKNLVSINDVDETTTLADVFDLERAYMRTVAALPDDDRAGHFHPSANADCGRRNVYEYIRSPGLTSTEVFAHQDRLRLKAGSLDTKAKQARTDEGGKGNKLIPDAVRERDNLDFGHALHELVGRRMMQIKAYYEARGFVMNVQLELGHNPAVDWLRKTYGIGGTTDALIELTNRKGIHQRGILETKSSKHDAFLELTGPKPGHLEQAHLYSFRFDAPVGWIWYFDKDDADRKVYRYLFDPGLFEDVVAKFSAWKAHAENGTLPDREEDFYMCPRCQYQVICRPEILNRIGLPSRIAEATKRGGFGTKRSLTVISSPQVKPPKTKPPKKNTLPGVITRKVP
jgi:CRISPR/Cas system-associated exonuclease Cas4 (RecB family)